ncbi:floral homeotic protein DEFICIENS-like isoform X1 [Salvia miltiorrhiza]|uniref:floral homeotic protein DEFICIENS-like isoform X1 n=1 Tax=Salvia miltiorrhiza TaxID=226208 RepID=UPI0025ABE713|nr:floral homeotic protein DEFICIENS-like isoform X1 [Salvia miltiorrhiza]
MIQPLLLSLSLSYSSPENLISIFYKDRSEEFEREREMARGKIQIKKIENQTNRQVTYSKRRNGLFKKAHELTVLCDAKISILMISSTQKLHEYISPTITTKQIFDEYQKTVRADLWSSHYEKMQEHLKKLKEINRNLKKEIRQRMGESLNDLGYEQMVNLIENMETSLKVIREKKLRNVEVIHRGLVLQFDARHEDPHYGLVENEGDYNSMLGFQHGGPRIIAVRLQPNHHHHPHHHHHHHHHHPSLHSGTGASDLTTFALLE